MKTISLTILLFSTQLILAQNFPWQPNEVILNGKDTFILVERIEFDSENRLSWLTQNTFDETGINTLKTEYDGTKQAYYSEQAMPDEIANSQQKCYKKYIQEHQDSNRRLESWSCYDDQNRLLRKHSYNELGELVDSLVIMYNERGFLSEYTWQTVSDWDGTVQVEDISQTHIVYSDSGKFSNSSYSTIKHYRNGIVSKSSSTTTYQFDLNGNLLEERQYWGPNSPVFNYSENGLPTKRDPDDTLHKIVRYDYDANNRLIHSCHSKSIDSAPYHQEFYERDKKGRPIKSYSLNEEGVEMRVNLIEYRKKWKKTKMISTVCADKVFVGQRTVSIIDDQGRFLTYTRFYDGIKVSSDEWSYHRTADFYQIELKQYFFESNAGSEKGISLTESSLTRWIYKRK